MAPDAKRHPCFNGHAAGDCGRIHLPVAPGCNIQCNFCNRKCDCINESRPGVTSAVLSPAQGAAYLDEVIARRPELTVAGIAGPGDPFADADKTLETLRLIRRNHPDLLLCVASNGLDVAPHVDELAELGVTHLTITVNAVDPAVGEKIYAWVRDGKRVLRGRAAAERLWQRQQDAIRRAKAAGIIVKINTIVIPGINDDHVTEVARTVKDLGADILNCMGLCSVPDTPFADIRPPSEEEIVEIQASAGLFLPQMKHCTRCRADAVGLLGEAMTDADLDARTRAAAGPLVPDEDRPYVAAASMEGALVNLHLGEAETLWVFTRTDSGTFELVDRRPAPPRGGGPARWTKLAETLRDCRALLASGAGATPTDALGEGGIKVIVMEGLVAEALEAIYAGKEIRAPIRTAGCGARCAAGASCSGGGEGCG